jgi:hypothetical protein
MPLLNVRLGPEDARLAQELRARGVSISDVVRRAIRDEAHKATAPDRASAAGLIRKMLVEYPTPAHARRTAKASDRREVKRVIRAKLRRP